MNFRLFLMFVAFAGGLGACDGCQEKTSDESTKSEARVAADAGPDDSIEQVQLTAEDVTPVYRALPAEDVVPRSVTIELAKPVINDGPRVASSATVVRVRPETPGTVSFSSNSGLVFQPSEPFKPATSYSIEVDAVESIDGALIPATPWKYEFKTPPFAFVRLSGAVFDTAKKRIYADMVFSADVQAASVKPFAKFKLDGGAMTDVTFEEGYGPNVVRVSGEAAAASPTGTLSMSLRAGVSDADGNIAPAAEATTSYKAGAPVELFTAVRKEGPAGFFIEVVCDDSSAPGGTRWYWDRAAYEDYQVSRRCLPTDESLATSISFSPPVKNLKVGSGEGGFNLIGDFSRGSYTLKIDAGMTTIDGGVVSETFTQTLAIPSRTPTLTFADKGRYVPQSKWKSLQLTHLNTPRVEVEIRHIPRQNVVFWLSGDEEVADERVSDVVAKETLKFDAAIDESKTSTIDIAALLGKILPGVYEVSVRSDSARDAVRLLVTNMNVIVKRSGQVPGEEWSREAFAWVMDMTTNLPVTDAAVTIIRKSGQTLGACKTDSTGGCRLELPDKTIDPNPPFAILATRGDEFTFLEFADLKVTPPDARIHGEPYLSETPYHAAFWGDRDVYRPGETAVVMATFRDPKFSAPTKSLPVEVVIRDPRGQTIRRDVLTTNAVGVIDVSQKLNDFAATGTYVADFNVAKRWVGRYEFKVEEFVPERMRLGVEAKSKHTLLGDPHEFYVNAEYLFGGSAEGSRVEMTCRVEPTTFAPDARADYSFGPATLRGRALDLGVTSATLDAEGIATLNCPQAAQSASVMGPSLLVAQAAVLEAGSGRTTVADAKMQLHPARHYIGLKAGSTSVEVGQVANVEGVVVDWDGKLMTDVAQVSVEFLRLEREYWWYSDDEGDSDWGQKIRPVVENRITASVKDGRFKLAYSPTESANGYVIRAIVEDDKGRSATELRFDSSRQYGWYYWDGDGQDRSATPKPTRPTTLGLDVPKEISVAQENVATFKIPFKGRLLITLETSRVTEYVWHDVEPGAFTWKFKVESFAPNVYVSGLLVKDPSLEGGDSYNPDRALGVQSIRVLPSEHILDVAITAPEEVRPHSALDVDVKVGASAGPAFVTVAAVDEGILQLTRYKTPNLEKQLFAKRRLGVDTFETIGWAMRLRDGGPGGRTGGGDDSEEEEASADGLGRAMAVKPVALWSGLVPVDKAGIAHVKFEIPTYRGALRVMAVAVNQDRTGMAEAKVTVRDPLVLQTTLPRFLSASDQAQIPVFVTNMTGKPGVVTVKLEVDEEDEPGLSGFPRESALALIRNRATQTVTLDDGKSGTVVFDVQAVRQSGVATFKVQASLGSVTSWDEGVVPMRPVGSLVQKTQQIELAAGTNSLANVLSGWVPTSERSTIWVTGVPYGKSFDHLKYLIRYPYGCIEQTTSSTRSLLYISEFVPMVDPESVARAGGLEAMIKSGIDRVLSMQTSDGGFAYWPGDAVASPWGSAYATHMLLDARDQGFEVPEQRINDAVAYLETDVENIANGRAADWRADTAAYMHYVLARAGKPKKALALRSAESFAQNVEDEDAERAYLTYAALYLAGDRRYEKQLKNVDVGALTTKRGNHWTYYSDARRRGLVLSVFFDLFKNAPEGESLAKIVGDFLGERPSHDYTTQELAWGITALGKWVQGSASSFEAPSLIANGKTLKPTTTPKAGNDRTWSLYRASEYASLDLTLPKADGKVYAVVSSQGVRVNQPTRVGSQGLRVSRVFRSPDGSELAVDDHKLGDLVYTEITLTNTSDRELPNIALVDRFAGGFEVENPRLGRGQLPDWVNTDGLWNVENMNIRDDRIEVFGALKPDESVSILYAARAVTAGQFQAPGPTAEGMYEPEVWAADAPAVIQVQGPWADLLH